MQTAAPEYAFIHRLTGCDALIAAPHCWVNKSLTNTPLPDVILNGFQSGFQHFQSGFQECALKPGAKQSP